MPFKIEANAGFWSLAAGYIYETSEFDQSKVTELVPTTPVTALHDMTDFDVAGMIVPGTVYVDHIIGTAVERPGTLWNQFAGSDSQDSGLHDSQDHGGYAGQSPPVIAAGIYFC